MKRILSLAMALCILCALSMPAFAKSGIRFTDVPTTHWACADIEALAAGGLVNGKGDGVFDPDAKLTEAELATIICRAKGFRVGEYAGKWYGQAVNDMNTFGYVPTRQEVIDPEWTRPCSRELAVYMVIKALGVPPTATATGKDARDFTDYASITLKNEVAAAVKYGIIGGFPDGSFGPNEPLTRAQVCTILNRAGFTTAADLPDENASPKTCEEIFSEVEATGLFTKNTTDDGLLVLTAKEHKYAGLTVTHDPSTDIIKVQAKEVDSSYVEDKDGNVILEDGSVGNADRHFYDKNGKALFASGLSYTSRQLLQQVLRIAFPTFYNEAIADTKALMTPPHVYCGLDEHPSALRYVDGHCVIWSMGGSEPGLGYTIYIYKLDSMEFCQLCRINASRSISTSPYDHMVLGETEEGVCEFNGITDAYELYRW